VHKPALSEDYINFIEDTLGFHGGKLLSYSLLGFDAM
jgi:hypothetical protein